MDRRYALLEANGARNMSDFNRKVAEGKPLRHPDAQEGDADRHRGRGARHPAACAPAAGVHRGRLPLIVMVVDELADLMMTVQADVETPLARLAQKARAMGLHLILATQRPSVNVITGLIKANFPSRIAFRVASKVDSRTILDQNGAEALLGKGDMLFLEPGKSEPMRLQGAYISTEESERIMERYRQWRLEQEQRGAREAAESQHPRRGARREMVEKPKAAGGCRRARPAVQGGRHRLRAEPGRLDLAAPAEARHRIRPRGTDHGSVGRGRHSRPANGSKPRDVRVGHRPDRRVLPVK